MPADESTAEISRLLDQWDAAMRSQPQLSAVLAADHVLDIGSADGDSHLVAILARMAEIVEKETEAYYKMDPDPFDDRHPGRADPNCALGHVLKVLFKNDNFMTKLVNEYLLYRDDTDNQLAFVLHTVSCRLLLDIMPGLETTVIFQDNEALVRNLIDWAQSAQDPLQSYATGLLASAMEIQDLAGIFKDSNATLVPMMIRRLKSLQEQNAKLIANRPLERPFQHVGCSPLRPTNSEISIVHLPSVQESEISDTKVPHIQLSSEIKSAGGDSVMSLSAKRLHSALEDSVENNDKSEMPFPLTSSPKRFRANASIDKSLAINSNKSNGSTVDNMEPVEKLQDAGLDAANQEVTDKSSSVPVGTLNRSGSLTHLTGPMPVGRSSGVNRSGNSSPRAWIGRRENTSNEGSNSCWAEMEPFVIGTYQMYPLTMEMQQRLILHYLQPMGEYQELLGHVFDNHVMDLLFYYIDLRNNKDVRLGFEALKYLAALLCHKRFAVDFISVGGVQRLLEVHRPSVAATGVSMCLYYLAYFEDAMERVCLLPQSILSELVGCVLWLLECSHESGRVHATMFFGLSFPFRIIVELFDEQDGLRKLVNVMSTQHIMNVEAGPNNLTEDQVFTSRQAARHVCVALRRYFEAHLAIRSDQIRRTHMHNEGGSPLAETPAYKATKFPPEVIQDNIELLLECLPNRMSWRPVTEHMRLGGIQLLMQLVAMATEWNTYTGKAETIRSALEILAICSVVPKAQLLLCESIKIPDREPVPAISVLLSLAEGDVLADADVQKAAINVIINSVCGPVSRLNNTAARMINGSARRRSGVRNSDDVLNSMWNAIRSNNGIMVLLKLMMVKVPITEADAIRALACKALVGLSRCDTVKQIISKLPLFNNAQLQQLMWEPVLQDKRQEHIKFCKYAAELIELVSGKPPHTAVDPSLDRIRRADIVSQTRIVYHEKELLQLMHDHLLKEGLVQTAAMLQKEACLPRPSTPPPQHPAAVHCYQQSAFTPKLNRQLSTPSSASLLSVTLPLNSGAVALHSSTPTASLQTPLSIANLPSSSRSALTPPSGSLKLTINRRLQSSSLTNHARMQQTKHIIHQKNESCLTGGSYFSSLTGGRRPVNVKQEMCVSLNKIVTSYLQHQHAACRNPIVTCPPFSLLTPHRCPDPKNRNSAPTNILSRLYRRAIVPPHGGPDGMKFDRKYIYSRFRPMKSYRDSSEDCFSCCAFTVDEQYLMLGTYNGELKFYNVQTAEEYMSSSCHMAVMTHCQPSKNGEMVLTSASWGTPLSALWKIGDGALEQMHDLSEDDYVEFSKQVQDRIIGTKDGVANIYDVTTGRRLSRLHDAALANSYTRNRATFNATDDLVLNDGVLWDVNSGRSIHKFDKFNPNISGVFHPNGLEIIINSEVWDLRTFHLLHTVPALDQCQIRFNHSGNVIYGAIHQDEDDNFEENRVKSPFGSSFRTFDGTDYSSIATIDVKRDIFDLCTDSSDCYLAVIENQRAAESFDDESLCRLYEVGRLKDEEDDQAEEEDEGREDDDDDDDDEDDDDDDSIDNDSPANSQAGDASNSPRGDRHGSGSDTDESEFVPDSSDSSGDDSDEDLDERLDDNDDSDDDDMENMLFELSDMSNF